MNFQINAIELQNSKSVYSHCGQIPAPKKVGSLNNYVSLKKYLV